MVEAKRANGIYSSPIVKTAIKTCHEKCLGLHLRQPFTSKIKSYSGINTQRSGRRFLEAGIEANFPLLALLSGFGVSELRASGQGSTGNVTVNSQNSAETF